MKMTTYNFFVFLMIISFPLLGMEFDTPEEKVQFWKKRLSDQGDDTLIEIASDVNQSEQRDAASTILDERSISVAPKSKLPIVANNSLYSVNKVDLGNNRLINNDDDVSYGLGAMLTWAMIWAIIEGCIAYKNLSHQECNNIGFVQKSALLAYKTGSAMLSRPGQVIAFGRNIIRKVLPSRK
jgi:hypothetical protein